MPISSSAAAVGGDAAMAPVRRRSPMRAVSVLAMTYLRNSQYPALSSIVDAIVSGDSDRNGTPGGSTLRRFAGQGGARIGTGRSRGRRRGPRADRARREL